MNKLIFVLIIILAACAPSQDAIQTAIAETLTAAPTATATVTVTAQPTLTQAAPAAAQSTSTPAPDTAASLGLEPIPGQAGWMDYTMEGFSISLPEEWKAADISQEGMAGVLKLIEGLDSPLTEEILETLLSGEIASMGMDGSIKFFARDVSPEASGNAMVSVLKQSLPLPVGGSVLCMFLPAILEKAGLEVVNSQCGLELNGMQGGMFETRVILRETPYRQQLYYYMDGSEVWILLSGVGETEWTKYEPILTDIAESFEAGTATP